MFDFSNLQPVDLTLSLKKGMRGFNSETANTVQEDGWNASLLHIYSHSGTHIDAPLHFGVTNKTIDEYPVSTFYGKAWVCKIPVSKPSQLLNLEDLGTVTERFQPGDSLLLETHWSQFEGQQKYRDELPRISKELASWCVQNKVRMLGVEQPSVADINNINELTEIHQILLAGGIIIIEGLTNLDLIKNETVILMAFPLKVEGCDGAPARVIAFDKKA